MSENDGLTKALKISNEERQKIIKRLTTEAVNRDIEIAQLKRDLNRMLKGGLWRTGK